FKKLIFSIETNYNEYYRKLPFEEVTVDHAISACWFFRKDLINEVGGLDYRIFYAPEDVDFCLRIWKRGKKILYYPNFEVIHFTQQLSYKCSIITFQHVWGLIYFFFKHRYLFRSPRFGDWER
ncbi:MAG: glycosyltransferase family 2 protein, partial [Candidatus Aminicenantes bacterium]|nr:glycosyltransferase family 2 protein [Candidatus Aminicenantes bacterium]